MVMGIVPLALDVDDVDDADVDEDVVHNSHF